MRGFSGGGGLTTDFKLSVNEFSSLLVSHFLAKRSDKLSSSDAERRGMYLCIINMRASCRYIHESQKRFVGCSLSLNIMLLRCMGINNYMN